MLYPKNTSPSLDRNLFRNPTAEYRGAPFWAWNGKLEPEELDRQLDILKKMGFGGGHIHDRIGMDVPYLSGEYMDLIRFSAEKAKEKSMLTWLYDDDRWPSGAAAGLVTRDPAFRGRVLLMLPRPFPETEAEIPDSPICPGLEDTGVFLACFDICLDEKGCLESGRQIGKNDAARGTKWYAYRVLLRGEEWYNGFTYADLLNRHATEAFLRLTHQAYFQLLGEEFGKTIPSIFTDEPQFIRKLPLRYAADRQRALLPWTDDLPETFGAAYGGEDLISGIPELFWELPQGKISVLRYHYHEHVCQRFTEAYPECCGSWCREHGLMLTGHLAGETSLRFQSDGIGEAMRHYRGFDLPGIDMLGASFEYNTAKQAQSAVHQLGREGMLSELYGVTGWDFDFRDHKLHGDWQAALGVTVRVPHLSWVTMAGEAKRDYPASINYQSPWWDQYARVENHFARLATAMTRGTPVVRIGVIHPIESFWLHQGPDAETAAVREELEENFSRVTQWLLFDHLDFDFISESMLPELCPAGTAPLPVGRMAYDAILVPGCETLRTTTLDRLEAFAGAGGTLIFAGKLPTLEEAVPSRRGLQLAESAVRVPMSRSAILEALEPQRLVELQNGDGSCPRDLLHQLRRDGDGLWLFLAHGKEPQNKDLSPCQDLTVRVKGCWKPTVFNTLTGSTEPIAFSVQKGQTEIFRKFYSYDSLLLRLEPAAEGASGNADLAETGWAGLTKPLPQTFAYTLSEPNVLLLDQAEWALDDGDWMPREEILRLDDRCRDTLGWFRRSSRMPQPWSVAEDPVHHRIRLRWRIQSQTTLDGLQLAMEDAASAALTLNGQPVEKHITGWFTDKAIQTLPLPAIPAGETVLEAELPFGRRTNLEWCYLLGKFGVQLLGSGAILTPAPEALAFGDLTTQGLPFYGGTVTYQIPVETQGGPLTIRSSQYRGGLQTVSLDDGEAKEIIYPPYTVSLGTPEAGHHMVHLTLYGSRVNCFGPVHLCDRTAIRTEPDFWRSTGDRWSYDYCLKPMGVLLTPELKEG